MLRRQFGMDTEPYFVTEWMENDGPDFSYIEIRPTETTKRRVELTNCYLFDDFYKGDIESKEYAEECGLSYGNRMTEEWLMDHLKEAVQIVDKSFVLEEGKPGDESTYYNMLTSDMTYTPYYLSYRELMSMTSWFEVELLPKSNIIAGRFEAGESDFSDVALQKTEYTEKAAIVMSWIIFDQCAAEDAAATEKAAEYGLSKENPITADWIVTHPKEAIEIKNLMKNYGEILYCEDEIEEIYEKVSRKEIKDIVQWFGELCKEGNGIEARDEAR